MIQQPVQNAQLPQASKREFDSERNTPPPRTPGSLLSPQIPLVEVSRRVRGRLDSVHGAETAHQDDDDGTPSPLQRLFAISQRSWQGVSGQAPASGQPDPVNSDPRSAAHSATSHNLPIDTVAASESSATPSSQTERETICRSLRIKYSKNPHVSSPPHYPVNSCTPGSSPQVESVGIATGLQSVGCV
jgi:hypothetical protein